MGLGGLELLFEGFDGDALLADSLKLALLERDVVDVANFVLPAVSVRLADFSTGVD